MSNDTIELTLTLNEFKELSLWKVRGKYKDFNDHELIKKIQDKFTDSNRGYNLDFSYINKEHEERLKNLTKEQAISVSTFLGIWFGIMVCIYIFGWSIGWVVRGFKNKDS